MHKKFNSLSVTLICEYNLIKNLIGIIPLSNVTYSITLEVVPPYGRSPLPKQTQLVDSPNFCISIGRYEDNDLVLPDPDQYVSGNHAKIEFNNNHFLLSDTSSNGTGIGNVENLIHHNTVELKRENLLIIGEYEVLVTIIHEKTTEQVDVTQAHPTNNKQTQIEVPPPIDEGMVPDNILEILFPSNGTKSPTEIEIEPPSKEETNRPSGNQMPDKEKQDPALEHVNSNLLLKAFMDGAGLSDKQIEVDDPVETLQLAGSMLRAIVDEMKSLLYVRAEKQREIGATGTIMGYEDVSQIKFSVSTDQALALLLEKGAGYLEPMDAIKYGFRDLKNDQQASTAATKAALEEILMKFAPQHYEEQFKEGFVFNKNKKIWNAYKDAYSKNVAQSKQDIFGEVFARAYDEEKRQLNLMLKF